jgi:hypothetical protein
MRFASNMNVAGTTNELTRVRHELDNLASARALDDLSTADELRYGELCQAERLLLQL